MINTLNQMKNEFTQALEHNHTLQEILNLKALYLGKEGKLSEVLKNLKNASLDEKKTVGKLSNEIKIFIEESIQNTLSSIELAEINQKLNENKIDITLRNSLIENGLVAGGLHPVTHVQRRVEDIFLSMGFDILDGPHIEDEYHNFEALNIPATHPARDMQDTFWFQNGVNLLRTHTSSMQIRGMEKWKTPPFQFVCPGKVFRCERTDATHESVFHQVEGMMVGKNITVGNLIYFLKTLLREIFQTNDFEIRLRTGFFPFVEPGFELDIRWLKNKNQKFTSKQDGWLELLPCGMIHPNVLKMSGIDPTIYNGFAFGLGLDRLVMVDFGIEDIRHLHSGDLRFNSQFKIY